MPSRITVTEIRRAFPNPVSWKNEDRPRSAYDVAEAFVRFVGKKKRQLRNFNDGGLLEDAVFVQALGEVNSVFRDPERKEHAYVQLSLITDACDSGYFELAWALLDRALQWDGRDRRFLDPVTPLSSLQEGRSGKEAGTAWNPRLQREMEELMAAADNP